MGDSTARTRAREIASGERRDNDYFGSPVSRAERIMSAAHGGQVLLSQAVVDGMHKILPAAVSLRDLGLVRLKDLSIREPVYPKAHQPVDRRIDRFEVAGDIRFAGSFPGELQLGNIARPNKSFSGGKGGNLGKILPAILGKIVDWRGFPADDRTDY